MELFQEQIDSTKNWLPYDGTVHYWGKIFNQKQSDTYYKILMEQVAWKNDEAIIFGKHIITKRKVAWYADKPYEYTYSKINRTALLWTPLLLEIKKTVQEKTQQEYNSVLLNLYHSGAEGMAWHSDDERDLRTNGSIASLSFGAKRKFAIKHKQTKYKQIFELDSGDLLEMKDQTQSHWIHNIPTTKRIHSPRVNLTFRQMIK
ncbi:alpha-ketoglutarate-dependent dioxygenase AlkB family protein [Tenacibaculum aiptasiae]|uniref:alpha-ketoglutarate-dependent dioxygenase AlkB family protein n=1 Tax=Tenacibaculum aiptasiae TaxID=426481 RepID=UPI003B5CD094